MGWCLENDTFYFDIPESANKPSTKRGFLSTIAQIYDPLGLISPFILKGKCVLQKVVSSELSWDQLICPEDKQEWDNWKNDLTELARLRIPRCHKLAGNVITTEIHHFSDASLTGYGACSYIRQMTDGGTTRCDLILAKSRVAPQKSTTIPRLELQAAVLATRLANTLRANTLRKELKMKIDKEIFWTDSKVVLGYIYNDVRKFHLYVANRVSEIRRSTEPPQWNYVPTQMNPADVASRGTSAKEIMEDERWFKGPQFLSKSNIPDFIKGNQVEKVIDEMDPEVRAKVLATMATSNTSSVVEIFERYSSWEKLVRSIAILKSCGKQRKLKLKELSTSDLEETEEFIIAAVQTAHYPLKEKEASLRKLNPKIDNMGIVRVGGRASASTTLTYQQKHPIIIPKRSHLAYLLTKHYHEKISHLGPRSTLAAIRDAGIWIINGPGQVKSLLASCVSCARLRKQPETQLMGELPKERLEPTPPFTNIAMDVFGPYYVKDRRTELKRWGLLITCLYSRAIHVEILEDMSSDSIIQALRCFMALRGPVQVIHCDNGTNFVGANNEMEKELETASVEMKHYLLQNRIHFKFNTPSASHQGGAAERMIRSVRAVLNSMAMKLKNRLDTKTLRTFFYEAGNIINNRPLSTTSTDNPEDNVITPNHILTMKNKLLLAPPPGHFSDDDLYSSRRWKAAQLAAEDFWKAWKTEYLQSITIRQKWRNAKENVKDGDVVLIKDENAARSD